MAAIERTVVDDLLIEILGKWCECCQRVTHAYRSEDGKWPCCDGCWHPYAYWTAETLASPLTERIRSEGAA